MTVAGLLQIVMPRLSTVPQTVAFIDAVQATQDLIVRRLWKRRSDLLKSAWTSAEIAADTATVSLPTDFLGFCENPYISGSSGWLLPLPENTRQIFTDSGTPVYYEIAALVLSLFPAPAVATVVKGMYFKVPAQITQMSDTLPFGGLFDPVFQDAAIQVGNKGIFATSNQAFEIAVNSYVDSLVHIRTSRRPQWVYPA